MAANLSEARTTKERVSAFMEAMLQNGKINKSFHPVILNLAKNFLAHTTDEDLARGLREVRDRVIPWLLDEAPEARPNEDNHTQQ